jgi:hypothetical protein
VAILVIDSIITEQIFKLIILLLFRSKTSEIVVHSTHLILQEKVENIKINVKGKNRNIFFK